MMEVNRVEGDQKAAGELTERRTVKDFMVVVEDLLQ